MNDMYKPIPFSPVALLASDIAAGATIIPVSDITAFPAPPSYATIGTDANAETIIYTAITGNSLSGCVRGVEGVAQQWSSGEHIARNFTAADHQAMIDNLLALAAELQQAYSPTNKPTASDVGALPISGGTLTGQLNVEPGQPGAYVAVKNSNGVKGDFYVDSNRLYLDVYNKNTNNVYRSLYIRNGEDEPGISYALRLYDKMESGSNHYTIYGEHNKELLTEAEKTLTLASGYSGAIYYHKNADGTICVNTLDLYGGFATGTPYTVGTLPVGYRPSVIKVTPVILGDGSIGQAIINVGGSIQVLRKNGSGSMTSQCNFSIAFKSA